jgi:hypothetical protein
VNEEATTPPEEPASSRATIELVPALVIVWSVDSPAREGRTRTFKQRSRERGAADRSAARRNR